jgi:hypothetical protein
VTAAYSPHADWRREDREAQRDAERQRLLLELMQISTWQRTYETNEGADRARQIRDQLKGTNR